MPKRPISLTKVKKKGRELKEKLVENIQNAANKYKYLYVLSHQNMTTAPFMKIRKDFQDSKFFVGKNKVMQFALGRTPEEEFKENFCSMSKLVKDECCLFFTDEESIGDYFEQFTSKDFARAGSIATKSVVLEAGENAFKGFSFAMEPHLRKLGLPTKLARQKIHLLKDVTVAEEGKALTPEQCKILKHLGERLGEFKLKILAKWTAADSKIETYDE